MHRDRHMTQRGFTLIELMLVVVILSALVAMVAPRLAGRSEEARRGVAEADIKGNLVLALKLYEVDNGRYPTTEQGLAALVEKPTSPPDAQKLERPVSGAGAARSLEATVSLSVSWQPSPS